MVVFAAVFAAALPVIVILTAAAVWETEVSQLAGSRGVTGEPPVGRGGSEAGICVERGAAASYSLAWLAAC